MAQRGEAAGAGEILLNSVDRDGMRQGFRSRALAFRRPRSDDSVVAGGGGGELKHFRQVIREAGVASAAGGSQFVTKASIEPY